jgi:ribosomal protein S18 acetylase RimI-like enzyme
MTVTTIRRAHFADARPLAEMHVASWQAAYRDLLPSAYLTSLSIERRVAGWEEWLLENSRQVFVIEGDGRVVGYVAFGPTRDHDLGAAEAGEVYGIYVHPDDWHKGYGKRLMKHALAGLSHEGFSLATLWVLKGNERAMRFYERCGFYTDGAAKQEHRQPDVILHELRYRRALPDGTASAE